MKPHPPGAVASLAYGVLALMAASVPGVGLMMGIAALVNARRSTNAQVAQPELYLASGLTTAGVVCGVIGGLFSLLATLLLLALLSLIGIAMHHLPSAPPISPHVPVL
jgi:4-hydroxybenzoate polyprenyltransferase